MIQTHYRQMQTVGFYCLNALNSRTTFNKDLFTRYKTAERKPIVDIGENSVITAENIGLEAELFVIDVIF